MRNIRGAKEKTTRLINTFIIIRSGWGPMPRKKVAWCLKTYSQYAAGLKNGKCHLGKLMAYRSRSQLPGHTVQFARKRNRSQRVMMWNIYWAFVGESSSSKNCSELMSTLLIYTDEDPLKNKALNLQEAISEKPRWYLKSTQTKCTRLFIALPPKWTKTHFKSGCLFIIAAKQCFAKRK